MATAMNIEYFQLQQPEKKTSPGTSVSSNIFVENVIIKLKGMIKPIITFIKYMAKANLNAETVNAEWKLSIW